MDGIENNKEPVKQKRLPYVSVLVLAVGLIIGILIGAMIQVMPDCQDCDTNSGAQIKFSCPEDFDMRIDAMCTSHSERPVFFELEDESYVAEGLVANGARCNINQDVNMFECYVCLSVAELGWTCTDTNAANRI